MSGEIIVLGGLQRSNDTTTKNRLGPIPIIGDLLGGSSKTKTRTELLIFLKPPSTVIGPGKPIRRPRDSERVADDTP